MSEAEIDEIESYLKAHPEWEAAENGDGWSIVSAAGLPFVIWHPKSFLECVIRNPEPGS